MRRSRWTAATSTSTAGLLMVRHAKFGKSRQLPLHPSTIRALARLPAPPGPAVPVGPNDTGAVRLPGRDPADLLQRPDRTFRRLRCAAPGSTPRSASCRPRLHDLRHSFAVRTMLDGYARWRRRPDQRCRCCRTYLGHVDPGVDVLVSVGRRRSCSPWPANAWSATSAGPAMSALAPTLQAFFTERLIRAAPGQPAHDRRLPRHVPAAAGVRSADQTANAALDAGHRRPRRAADRRVPRPPRARAAATASAPATPAWPRSTRCFGYAALRHPEHAADHRAGAGHPAQTLRPRARHLPHRAPRSTRCSPPPTAPPGSAGATTRCSSSPSRPGCGSPS